jgi:exodeoxyribonuclease-3
LFKLITLNLNGVRSASKKGVDAWLRKSTADCICVQELKAQQDDLDDSLSALGGLKGYFHFAEKKGYSGVGIYSKHEPSDVVIGFANTEFDAEGRYIELRFDTPQRKLSIISSYFPSGSSGEERQEAKFRFLDSMGPHLASLKDSRQFILCGDINIAHKEQDLKNWRSNQKNSGFLPEERVWMDKLIKEVGLSDVYRLLHPDTTAECYTWWSNRGQAWANNVGWRLDYHLATHELAKNAKASSVYKEERFSDHAPLTIDYDFAI